MVGSDWLKSKNWLKNKEKRDKNNFFKFYFPHSLVFYLMAKFKHCSVRQSKVTAENVQHARDLVVNHLGCDIWDVRKLVFYPKKCCQFHRWSLHMSLYGLFIAFIQCILSSEWLWNSYCSSVCMQLSSTCLGVAMWTSRAKAVVYVVRRRSLWFSDDSE